MRFILIVFLLMNYGCSNQTSPLNRIQGEWKAGGDDGEGHSWYLTYTFTKDSYTMKGYPPIAETGKLKCKEVKGDSMLIEFNVDKSSPNLSDHTNWIVIKENTMVLNSMNFTKSDVDNK